MGGASFLSWWQHRANRRARGRERYGGQKTRASASLSEAPYLGEAHQELPLEEHLPLSLPYFILKSIANWIWRSTSKLHSSVVISFSRRGWG